MDSLKVKGLTKRHGDVVALDGMSLEVPAGEVFGFVGRNGSGKTTTMRIVLRVLAADEGEVSFDENPLTAEARRRIGHLLEPRARARPADLDALRGKYEAMCVYFYPPSGRS